MRYTIEEIRQMPEGQTFDCKSILIIHVPASPRLHANQADEPKKGGTRQIEKLPIITGDNPFSQRFVSCLASLAIYYL